MSHRARAVVIALSLFVVILVLTPADEIASHKIEQVFVTNFPKVQTIEGRVSLTESIHQTELRTFKDVLVPPVRPHETTRLIDAGVLDTTGFPAVVLSLHGITKGDVTRPGTVGAILFPDEERIQQGFNERGLTPFSLEAAANGVSADTPYFVSAQPRYGIAFTRYRVLLYNTTDKTVTVDLYAYLTN
jgi:hypothetical protein